MLPLALACPSLHNIVVDTTSTAQKCVTYLRANKLGRATFICLDKVQDLSQRMMTSKGKTPDNAPRLFDLVQTNDETFLPAFYYATKDTLVAPTMDVATKYAFGSGGQRWRVVTMGGQVVDIAGTMSGGGGKPMKGAMTGALMGESNSKKVRQGQAAPDDDVIDLNKLQQVINTIDNELQTLRATKVQLETSIKNQATTVKDTGIAAEEGIAGSERASEDSAATDQPRGFVEYSTGIDTRGTTTTEPSAVDAFAPLSRVCQLPRKPQNKSKVRWLLFSNTSSTQVALSSRSCSNSVTHKAVNSISCQHKSTS